MAADYLVAQGFQILVRNFRTRYGEVDLVASEGDAVVFVEVKTCRSGTYGLSEESVTRAKRRRLALTAQQYLQEQGLEDRAWRVDVVSISLGRGGPELGHLAGVAVEEPSA